jgi:hypothetical protein
MNIKIKNPYSEKVRYGTTMQKCKQPKKYENSVIILIIRSLIFNFIEDRKTYGKQNIRQENKYKV